MPKRGGEGPGKMKTSDHLNGGDAGVKAKVGPDGKVIWSDDLPEFFQFYDPVICSENVLIPPDFEKNFGGDIPRIVTLTTESGTSFQVNLSRIDEHLYLQHGWPDFAQENSLEDNDILTFCYGGNSLFLVKVFAVNSCKKIAHDTISRTNGRKSPKNLKGCESSGPGNSKRNLSAAQNLSPKRKSSQKYPDKKPSFSVVVSAYPLHPRRGRLNIPKEFWSVHMKTDGDERTATLWMKKKSWSVGLFIRTERMQFVSEGWRDFVKDNSLKIGDLCTFQKINGEDDAFEVTIRR